MKNSIRINIGSKIELELHTSNNGFLPNLGLKDSDGLDY